MTTDPEDSLSYFRRLARAVPEDGHAPPGFHTRVMSRLGDRAGIARNVFHGLLWKGVLTSLACATLSGSLLFFGAFSQDDEDEATDEIAALQADFE